MSDFLTEMAASSRLRAERAREPGRAVGSSGGVGSGAPVVPLDLSTRGFDLIAEAKLASPSEGRLAPADDGLSSVTELAGALAASGAAVISVLTEPVRFEGDLLHLETVAARLQVPVMRKDFLVDPIQVVEARAAGASGVLLIARMLGAQLLEEMTEAVLDLGMFALIELFDASDIEVASSVFDRKVLVGVNARDLATLRVDPERHENLAPLLPDGLPWVAESGVVTPEDAARVAGLGYRLALVGTGLMKAADPSRLAAAMIEAGRDASAVAEPR